MVKKKQTKKGKASRAPVKVAARKPRSGRVPVVKVTKPWGHETIWALSDRYVGKILHINAGHELSVQYHNKKDETIYLLSGEMKIAPELPVVPSGVIGRGAPPSML